MFSTLRLVPRHTHTMSSTFRLVPRHIHEMASTLTLVEANAPELSKPPVNILVPTQLNVRNEIDVKLLETAVIKYIKTQPNLKSGVKFIDGKLCFVPLDSITDVLETLPPTQNVEEVCFKYSNQHFRVDYQHFSPLKLFYIRKSSTRVDLIVCFAHHSGDATNGMRMVHAILDTYSKLKKNIHGNLKFYEPAPCHKDMISLAFGSVDRNQAEKGFLKNQLENLEKCNAIFPIEEGIPQLEDSLCCTSTREAYQTFVTKCKSEKTTVGVALTTAMNYGFAGYLFNNYPNTTPENISICYCLNINLRGRVPNGVSADCVHDCASENLYNTTFSIKTPFWDICRQTKKLFDTNINDLKYCYFDFLYSDSITESAIAKEVRKQNQGLLYSHDVANMGRYLIVLIV